MSSYDSAFRSLWKRAGWWRFFFISSALFALTFLVVTYENWVRYQGSDFVEKMPDQAVYKNNKPVEPAVKANASSIPATGQQSRSLPPTTTFSMASGGSSGQNNTGVDPALVGRLASDAITIGGYKIYLPPGKWAMLANFNINIPDRNMFGAAYYLGQIEKKRLVGAVRIVALRSKDTTGEGFSEVPFCKRTDLLHLTVDASNSAGHQACWGIYNYFTSGLQQWADKSVAIDNLDRAAAGNLSSKDVTYPQDFVGVQFTRAENWGLLEASYLFSPEHQGIKSNLAASYIDSDWYIKNIARSPEKKLYVDQLKSWGSNFWPKFQSGFTLSE